MDVVEIDPAIARVAKEQFEFNESDRLRIVIGDGLEYITNHKSKKLLMKNMYFERIF